MAIRNRIIPLIYRVAAFSLCVYALIVIFGVDATAAQPYRSLLYFGTQCTIATTVLLGFSIVFNFIDLLKHGPNGIAASSFMPLNLAVLSYLLSDTLIFIFDSRLGGDLITYLNNNGNIPSILEHIIVPALFLFDWLLFQEKGSVKWTSGLFWIFYPGIYTLATIIAKEVWASNTYLYEFLNAYHFSSYENFFSGNGGWNGVAVYIVLFTALFEGMGSLLIFINKALAGRYRRKRLGDKPKQF